MTGELHRTILLRGTTQTFIYELKLRTLRKMDFERPLDALNAARNKRVLVELKNKHQVLGQLKAFDIHINVVLDDSEERDENGQTIKKLGQVFIRGDMIVFVSPAT